MAQHQLTYVDTVAKAAVEHPRKYATLAAIVAVVFFQRRHVNLEQENASISVIRIIWVERKRRK